MRTKVIVVLFALLCAAFWIFAFSPQAREIFVAPDGLEDEVYTEEIRQRCDVALRSLEALPQARSAESPAARAGIVDAGTAVLRDMVGDIAATTGGTDDDRRLIGLWLADWDVYLGDRDRHVERLVDEGDVRFLTTEDRGIFINERMNGFARRNDLDNCETPGDL